MLNIMHVRPFRDRHGRGQRGPLIPSAVPRYASRSQLFDAAVLDAYAPLAERFGEQLKHVDVAIDTIPRMRLQITEDVCADGVIPLGRVIPAGVDSRGKPTRPRFVLFRKPIEHRCINAQERADLLNHVLTYLVANYLNILPEMIDPDFQSL